MIWVTKVHNIHHYNQNEQNVLQIYCKRRSLNAQIVPKVLSICNYHDWNHKWAQYEDQQVVYKELYEITPCEHAVQFSFR